MRTGSAPGCRFRPSRHPGESSGTNCPAAAKAQAPLWTGHRGWRGAEGFPGPGGGGAGRELGPRRLCAHFPARPLARPRGAGSPLPLGSAGGRPLSGCAPRAAAGSLAQRLARGEWLGAGPKLSPRPDPSSASPLQRASQEAQDTRLQLTVRRAPRASLFSVPHPSPSVPRVRVWRGQKGGTRVGPQDGVPGGAKGQEQLSGFRGSGRCRGSAHKLPDSRGVREGSSEASRLAAGSPQAGRRPSGGGRPAPRDGRQACRPASSTTTRSCR